MELIISLCFILLFVPDSLINKTSFQCTEHQNFNFTIPLPDQDRNSVSSSSTTQENNPQLSSSSSSFLISQNETNSSSSTVFSSSSTPSLITSSSFDSPSCVGIPYPTHFYPLTENFTDVMTFDNSLMNSGNGLFFTQTNNISSLYIPSNAGNNVLSLDSSISLSASWSVAFWVKFIVNTNFPTLLFYTLDSNPETRVEIYYFNQFNTIQVLMNNASPNFPITMSQNSFVPNIWNQIVVTFNNSFPNPEAILYVNTIPGCNTFNFDNNCSDNAGYTKPTMYNGSTNDLKLAGGMSGQAYALNGELHSLMIWNETLSVVDINVLYSFF